MWHVTPDTWHVFVFVIYDIMKIWRKRLTELINYEAVYRTAPATQGLLNIYKQSSSPGSAFNYKTYTPHNAMLSVEGIIVHKKWPDWIHKILKKKKVVKFW